MTEFGDNLRAIKKAHEETEQQNSDLESGQERVKNQQEAQTKDVVESLAKQYLDPIIEQINTALADGHGDIDLDIKVIRWAHKPPEFKAKRSIKWDVSLVDNKPHETSYNKIGLAINNFGEVEILIDNPGEYSLNADFKLPEVKKPNVTTDGWKRIIEKQIERSLELGLHHWHPKFFDRKYGVTPEREKALATFRDEFQSQ